MIVIDFRNINFLSTYDAHAIKSRKSFSEKSNLFRRSLPSNYQAMLTENRIFLDLHKPCVKNMVGRNGIVFSEGALTNPSHSKCIQGIYPKTWNDINRNNFSFNRKPYIYSQSLSKPHHIIIVITCSHLI